MNQNVSADEPSNPATSDDAKAKRNAFLLASAQALANSNIIVNTALGAIIGSYLADDKIFATVPVTTMIVGTALSTMPASLYMRRVGRRTGFITGVLIGMTGAAMVTAALLMHNFVFACFGTFVLGLAHAFTQYYRFAAADTASAAFRPKAISWVLAGGIAAAFIGPQIIIWGKDLLAPVQFAGAYACLIGMGVLTIAVLCFIDVPDPKTEVHAEPARPLSEILKQRRLITAIACAMVSYSMMSLVMTATPLAMLAHHLSVDDAAFVIQWHVVAMFGPSFFTGNLIQRFGAENMIMLGLTLIIGCGIAALSGVDLHHFWIALVFLGLGWNFSFIAATTMVVGCYRTSERNKVQGINDLAVFGTVALASLLSGAVFQLFGWNVVLFVQLFVATAVLLSMAIWKMSANRAIASQ